MRELTRILTLTPRRAAQLRRLDCCCTATAATPSAICSPCARPARCSTPARPCARSARRSTRCAVAIPGSSSRWPRCGSCWRAAGCSPSPTACGSIRAPARRCSTSTHRGLEAAAAATLVTGLVRPLAPPVEQAETWFERASEWDGDPAQWEDAIDAYRRVVAIDPTYAAAWNNLGLLLHRMGQYDEARRRLHGGARAGRAVLRGGLQPRLAARGPRRRRRGDPLLPARAGALTRLRRRPLQPRRRAGPRGPRGRGASVTGSATWSWTPAARGPASRARTSRSWSPPGDPPE